MDPHETSPFEGYRYVTEDVPPIRGRLKQCPEDFVVEELPLYAPEGSGTHIFFCLEKRGISTREAIRRVAEALACKPSEFGYAGLKDAVAVTRQVVSIEHVSLDSVQALDVADVRILWAEKHRNKLKIGHLRGNRFQIRVRGVPAHLVPRAREVLERLAQVGVPNYFGEQRFGARRQGHMLGRCLILGHHEAFLDQLVGAPGVGGSQALDPVREAHARGDHAEALASLPRRFNDLRGPLKVLAQGGTAESAVVAVPRSLRQLLISSYQSFLFNLVLSRRVDHLGTILEGDVAYLHDRGASFLVEDAPAEQGRADRFEISPTGPIFGYRMLEASGRPGELERAVLAEFGLTLEHFKMIGMGLNQRGTRRPLRFPLGELRVEAMEDGFEVCFVLPKGCYATTALEEVFKRREEDARSDGERDREADSP